MSEQGKTVLILGNGFDLVHNLSTRYSDFLEFCKRIRRMWEHYENDEQGELKSFIFYLYDWTGVESIIEKLAEIFKTRVIDADGDVVINNKELKEIRKLVVNNIWFLYLEKLYDQQLFRGINWIDFEHEISFIIQSFDKSTNNLTDIFTDILSKMKDGGINQKLYIFEMIFTEKMRIEQLIDKGNKGYRDITYKDFRYILYKDLEELIRALELYLSEFVDTIGVGELVSEIEDLEPDYVINFNYTHTYERLYHKSKNGVFHIHGECDKDRPIEDNNMVLGIDEYWGKDERNSHTNFTIFKKFAQRIQKHTGIDHYRYMTDINEIYRRNGSGLYYKGRDVFDRLLPDEISKVYVFGHSLDITDKDILAEFIGSDATDVTIYCYDKGVEGDLIANTIKLIGEQRLLEKVNHVPPMLKFVIQEKEIANNAEEK